MYEPILIAKVRKERTVTIPAGGWIILGTPDEGLAASIAKRSKLVQSGNVSDEFSSVLIGRIQDTSPPARFVTAADAQKAQDLKKANDRAVVEQHQNAIQLRVNAEADETKRRAQEHAERLAEINAQNDAIRTRGGTVKDSQTQSEDLLAATEKAAAESTNELKLEELNAKNQGELLAIADELIKAGRISAPEKTSKGALVQAILAAKPAAPAATSTLAPQP